MAEPENDPLLSQSKEQDDSDQEDDHHHPDFTPRPAPIASRGPLSRLQTGLSVSSSRQKLDRHSWSGSISSAVPSPLIDHQSNQYHPISASIINYTPSNTSTHTLLDGNGVRRWRYDDYTTVDWVRDSVREKKRLGAVKKGPLYLVYYDASQAWLVLTVIGLLTGITAFSLLSIMVPFLESIRIKPAGGIIWFTSVGLVYVTVAFVIVGFGGRQGSERETMRYDAAGSGIPEVKVILGGFILRGFLGLRTLLIKLLSLPFVLASGIVLGAQGPLVHLACAIGNVTTRLFQKYGDNEGKRREIMSAACAAGVSVAFGAPVGGVLFSLEECSFFFPAKTMWRSFYCALVAALTLKVLGGVEREFEMTGAWRGEEIVIFMGVGVLGGLYGAAFIKSTAYFGKYFAEDGVNNRSRYHISPFVRVMIISLATSILSFPLHLSRVNNLLLIRELFWNCETKSSQDTLTNTQDTFHHICKSDSFIPLQLLWLLVLKSTLMIFTFGTRLPGGIFIPSTVVGALTGRLVGIICQNFVSDKTTVVPAIYALVGAAAFLSGVTRMTVSLCVILFELTGGLTYVLPIMSAIIVAKWTGDAFGRDSIHDQLIKDKGYPYLNSKRSNLAPDGVVTDIMERSSELLLFVESIYRISDIEGMLEAKAITSPRMDGGFPVLKGGSRVLVGFITQTDLALALELVRDGYASNSSPRDTESDNRQHDGGLIVFGEAALRHQEFATGSPQITMPFLDEEGTFGERYADLSQWVDRSPLTVLSSSSCLIVLELFTKLGVRSLIVVEDGAFVGIVHKKRVLSYLAGK